MRPQLSQETQRGIEFLKGIVERGKTLKLSEPLLHSSRSDSFFLGISGMGKTYEIYLSRDQLSDLPGTTEYQTSANELARSLDKRINNVDPNLFMTLSGRLLHIEIKWPIQPWYENGMPTTATFVWVLVTDHISKELARCRFKTNGLQRMTGFGIDPFNEYEIVTNSIRTAVDSGTVTFYPSSEKHPDPVIGNIIEPTRAGTVTADDAIKQFLANKIWFLAFKAGGSESLAWIGDTWDASYLGCSRQQLLQQASILDAQKKIALSDSREYASVGQQLLADDGPNRAAKASLLPRVSQFRTALNAYELGKSLGEGGSGRVFKATSEGGEVYALKYLKPEVRSKQKARRFTNEIYFCMKNSHPNVVTVLDHGLAVLSDVEVPFYVMPLYPQTLRDVMRENWQADTLLGLFRQIVNGVSAAHGRGIWHRDLKPENILYDPITGRAVISDFGIAHFTEELLHAQVETRASERLANFRYAAPEQVTNASVDHRADIYALGLILYELLSGELLRGTSHRRVATIHPHLAAFDSLIEKMTSQFPSGRYSDIVEVQEELARCTGSASVTG
jgi:tRNA A-37 threonylcarbamoyl transferase component Bud32